MMLRNQMMILLLNGGVWVSKPDMYNAKTAIMALVICMTKS